MIIWPAILRFNGDDELSFIFDQNEWKTDSDLYFHSYAEGDEFIDSQGKIYDLAFDEINKVVELKETGATISIREFEQLVKKHMVQLNQCCISKFQLSSYQEGMMIVRQVIEEKPDSLFNCQAGLATG